MRWLLGPAVGLMFGLAAYGGTAMIGAQQAPKLSCNVTTIPTRSASVETTCTVESFAPNTPVEFVLERGSVGQVTTDATGQASHTFRIPAGFETPGEITIRASGGGVEASTTIVVIAHPPAAAVPAQPGLTG
jgi:hypothetical protein